MSNKGQIRDTAGTKRPNPTYSQYQKTSRPEPPKVEKKKKEKKPALNATNCRHNKFHNNCMKSEKYTRVKSTLEPSNIAPSSRPRAQPKSTIIHSSQLLSY